MYHVFLYHGVADDPSTDDLNGKPGKHIMRIKTRIIFEKSFITTAYFFDV